MYVRVLNANKILCRVLSYVVFSFSVIFLTHLLCILIFKIMYPVIFYGIVNLYILLEIIPSQLVQS